MVHVLHRFWPVIFFCVLAARAQEITGSIVGTIYDSSGHPLSGAVIQVINSDRNQTVRSLHVDSSGNYSALLLPVGSYQVIAQAPGYESGRVDDVQVDVGSRTTCMVNLPVGKPRAERARTAAWGVELQTQAAAGLISPVQVRELSLNDRVYEQLVALMPGVSSNSSDELYIGVTNPLGQTNQVAFSFNGNRVTQNNWTIDGADNLDRGSNNTLLNYPSIEGIAEFKVMRAQYDAEYGRDAGGQVNVITRSGTSQWHGSAYEFLRNDALAANSFINNHFSEPRQPLRYNNFGWTLGGPVFIPHHYNQDRNKTFFFFSQEFRRIVTSNTIQGFAPTEAEKNGLFPVPVCTRKGFTGPCQPSNTILPSMFDPVAAEYLRDIWANIPDSTDPLKHTLVSTQSSRFHHRQELLRIDQLVGPRLSLFGRYIQDDIPTTEPALFGAAGYPGLSTTKTNSPAKNLAVRATLALSANLLNEVGYSYSRGAIEGDPVGLNLSRNSPDIHVPLPFTTTLDRVPPVFFPGTFSPLRGFGPYRELNRDQNVFDSVSSVLGRHTLKYGVSFHHFRKSENAANDNTGRFNVDSSGAPKLGTSPYNIAFEQAWANFLLGNAVQFRQTSVDSTPNILANQFEAFAQDQFRVRRNLSLSYGLRYSLFRQPTEAQGQLTNFDPRAYNPAHAAQLDPLTGKIVVPASDPLNGLVGPGAGLDHRFGTKSANENPLNFAPRLGFAWDPVGRGRTVVRGGYGIYFDATQFQMYELNVQTNPPYVERLIVNKTSLSDPTSGNTVSNTPRNLHGTPYQSHTPYVQEWSLDVQQELFTNAVLDVGYYGSKSTHLLGGVELNEVLPSVADANPKVNIDALRPFQGYSFIDALENWFGANYHSLQTSLQYRVRSGGILALNYTWSHGLTDNPGDMGFTVQNIYDIRAEYGPTLLDRRHVFSADFVYPLPWLRNRRSLTGAFLGGWEMAGIVTANSGLPFSVTRGGNLAISGASSIVPRTDMTGDPNANAPHTFDRWFDTSVFAPVPAGVHRPGNEPPGAVRGPGSIRFDFSAFKNIRLEERLTMQFRAEAFNMFNHTNFTSLDTSLTSPTFGQVTGTGDPRVLQLALKLLF